MDMLNFTCFCLKARFKCCLEVLCTDWLLFFYCFALNEVHAFMYCVLMSHLCLSIFMLAVFWRKSNFCLVLWSNQQHHQFLQSVIYKLVQIMYHLFTPTHASAAKWKHVCQGLTRFFFNSNRFKVEEVLSSNSAKSEVTSGKWSNTARQSSQGKSKGKGRQTKKQTRSRTVEVTLI